MTFFWLAFFGSAACAWLIGYGMGYLRGIRDPVAAADGSDGDRDFGGGWSDQEIGGSDAAPGVAPLTRSRHARDNERMIEGAGRAL